MLKIINRIFLVLLLVGCSVQKSAFNEEQIKVLQSAFYGQQVKFAAALNLLKNAIKPSAIDLKKLEVTPTPAPAK
jgi:hypothetical protein